MTSNKILAGALALGLAFSGSSAMAQTTTTDEVKCVQNELNTLGFDAGPSDGIIGVKTFLAGEAYIRYMRANGEKGWAQPSLNTANARHWCEKVAQAHPKVASFWKDVRDAAQPTDPKAIYDLAYKFEVGAGVSKNPGLAARWYLRAAELGYAPAQRNLAGMYAAGYGVIKNLDTARYWFLSAANQGDAHAQFMLGTKYAGTHEMQLRWLWKAAEQGHSAAIYELEKRLDI